MLERKFPWDDVEQLPALIQKSWGEVIAAREALNTHMQNAHGGKYLSGCHTCPKLTVNMMDAQGEYNGLVGHYDYLIQAANKQG